jgi:hypothetical protein
MVTDLRTGQLTAFESCNVADVNARITVCQTLFPANRTILAFSGSCESFWGTIFGNVLEVIRYPGKTREFAEA